MGKGIYMTTKGSSQFYDEEKYRREQHTLSLDQDPQKHRGGG